MISNHSLTPKETLAELDKYIVGQADAKRSVAIALRNRWRQAAGAIPACGRRSPRKISS